MIKIIYSPESKLSLATTRKTIKCKNESIACLNRKVNKLSVEEVLGWKLRKCQKWKYNVSQPKSEETIGWRSSRLKIKKMPKMKV